MLAWCGGSLERTGPRLLLHLHDNLGKRKALAEEHRSFKLLLMEETGLPPAQETEELFQRLMKN